MRTELKYRLLITLGAVALFAVIYYLGIAGRKPIVPPSLPPQWIVENSLRPPSAPPELADDGDKQDLLTAIDMSLRYLQRQDAAKEQHFGARAVTVADARASLEDFRAHLDELGLTPALYSYVADNFDFLRSGADETIFTGYYEAHLRGSRKKSETYKYPLYGVPDDLYVIDLKKFLPPDKYPHLPAVLRGRIDSERHVVPYYDRAEIEQKKVLAGRKLEIVWVDNAVDAFFLEIQGSGVITLDDGSEMRVNYAQSNGHPYRAIGNYMIEKKLIPSGQVSMQSIRAELEAHPDKAAAALAYNPSYVFFHEVSEGPLGNLQVRLTAQRSVATDSSLFPHGALMFLDTSLPLLQDHTVAGSKPFRRFVLNQDTGGAIKTPARIDIFMGSSPESQELAGVTKQKGTFYFLLKKST